MIERDNNEYTLDHEDKQVQDVIMKPEPSKYDAIVLKKNLSCSYPNIPIKDAIRKEREKLQQELQHSQANLDVRQCQVIQHLLEVTEAVAANYSQEEFKMDSVHRDINGEKKHNANYYTRQEASGSVFFASCTFFYQPKTDLQYLISVPFNYF